MTIRTHTARLLTLLFCTLLTLCVVPTTLFAGEQEDTVKQAVTALDLASSPSLGEADAPVTIIVFSDYQCPYCKKAEATLIDIKRHYGDDVRLVFKQFPLPFHKQAVPAARAALAAHAQGKFELMHRQLFSRGDALEKAPNIDDYMILLAGFIGLDVDQFKIDYASDATTKLLEQDQALVKTLNIRGTPNFLVNGIKLTGAHPVDRFKEVIDPELASSKKLIKEGKVKRTKIHATRFAKNFGAGLDEAALKEAKRDKDAKAAAAKEATVHYVPVEKADPVHGNRDNALVTLVVFSDFECPYCKRGSDTINELQKHYGKKELRIIFKHLPLAFHKHAEPAARAAVAAHAQGEFWAMHDQLFYDQQALKTGGSEYFISLANKLELDVKKFERDIDSKRTRLKVETDKTLAEELGVRGTPNFFVNGIKITGAQPADVFKEAIDAQLELAAKMKKDEKGLKGEKLYKKLVEHNKAHAKPAPKKRAAVPDALTPKQLKTLRATSSSDVLGNRKKAKVIIYEFTDLQCPFCQRADGTMQELHDRYGEDLAIVTFHFPLPFHKQAEHAARAVIAADKQGKAHAMRTLIFEDQKQLKSAKDIDAHLASYARELGLNVKKFKKDYASKSTSQKVSDDMALGKEMEVRGTPHFFVEDQRLVGAQPVDKFADVIDESMAK
jgi:protein-disulfide isomerase